MLSELGDDWKDYDVIGVDEGQFFKDVSILQLLFTKGVFSHSLRGYQLLLKVTEK
jgi:hypothetical protein